MLQRWWQGVKHPSLSSAASAPSPTTVGLSRLPALLLLWEDCGFMMQIKVDRKPLHQSPPDHLHHFFSSETWGLFGGKCIHFFCGCSLWKWQGTCFSVDTSCLNQYSSGLQESKRIECVFPPRPQHRWSITTAELLSLFSLEFLFSLPKMNDHVFGGWNRP